MPNTTKVALPGVAGLLLTFVFSGFGELRMFQLLPPSLSPLCFCSDPE